MAAGPEISQPSLNLEQLKQLLDAYENRQARSVGYSLLTTVGAGVVILSIGASLLFAWKYYQESIRTVQEAAHQTEALRVQIAKNAADNDVIRKSVNSAFKQLVEFNKGNPEAFGFDISDGSHGAQNPQSKTCASGQFITGVRTYIEDNHIKMVFVCSALGNVQLP